MLDKEELIANLVNTIRQDRSIRMVLLLNEDIVAQYEAGVAYALDITLVTQQLELVQQNTTWHEQFSSQLAMQMPQDAMLFPPSDKHFSYLVLLEDGNRLTIKLLSNEDALHLLTQDDTIEVLFDKDQVVQQLQTSDIVECPTVEQFHDCCHTFWWGQTSVINSLTKKEHIAAVEQFHQLVRTQLLRMLTWKVASDNRFEVVVNENYKQLPQYLMSQQYEQLLQTYNLSSETAMKQAITMAQALFREASISISRHLSIPYPADDAQVTQLLTPLIK